MTAAPPRTRSLTRERLLEFANSRTDPGERERLVELAGKWKHGWIPLDAVAMAIKARQRKGDGVRRRGIGDQSHLEAYRPHTAGKSRLDPKGAAAHASLTTGVRGKGRPPARARGEARATAAERASYDASAPHRQALADQTAKHEATRAAAAEAVRLKAPELKKRAAAGDDVAKAELARRAAKREGHRAPPPSSTKPAVNYGRTREEKHAQAQADLRTIAANPQLQGKPGAPTPSASDGGGMIVHHRADGTVGMISREDAQRKLAAAYTHTELVAELKRAKPGSPAEKILREEGIRRLQQAEHPDAPPRVSTETIKKARKPSRMYEEFRAEREQQDRRFEAHAKGGVGIGDTSSQEYKDYFGVGDHSTTPQEERLTFEKFRQQRASGKAEERAHAAAYKAGFALGKEHARKPSSPAAHDAQYNAHAHGHDEEMFSGGYGDGIIAASKPRTPVARTPKATYRPTDAAHTEDAAHADAGATARLEDNRARFPKGARVSFKEGSNRPLQYGRVRNHSHKGVEVERDRGGLVTRLGDDLKVEKEPALPGSRPSGNLAERGHDPAAYTTQHAADLNAKLAQSHPIGSTVVARQPGIEQATQGVISAHLPNGMVEVGYKDRHGKVQRGTFNPSHVNRRIGGGEMPDHPDAAQVARDKAFRAQSEAQTAAAISTLASRDMADLRRLAESKAVKPKVRQAALAELRRRETPEQTAERIGMTFPKPTVKGHTVIGEGTVERSAPAAGTVRLEGNQSVAITGPNAGKVREPDAPSAKIRVEHTGDGTVVHGTERGDTETTAALKAQGFKWSRNLNGWYLPRTWNEPTRDARVRGLEARLGNKITVERGSKARSGTPAEQAQERVDRAHASAARNSGRAEKLTAEAERRFQAAHDATAGIPFGQPILAGHHSQRGHERALEKSHSNMRAGVDAQAAAEDAQRRAGSAQARAAMQTDPRAAARRLERNEAELRKVQRTLHGTGKEIYGTDKPATGEHADRLRAMEADLTAKIAHDRNIAGDLVGAPGEPARYGKHNVKPGDVVTIRGRAHVVHSTGPKNAKLMTEVGPLPYAYTQIGGVNSLDAMPTDALKRTLAKSNQSAGFGNGRRALPPAVVSRIEAILRDRGETP